MTCYFDFMHIVNMQKKSSILQGSILFFAKK